MTKEDSNVIVTTKSLNKPISSDLKQPIRRMISSKVISRQGPVCKIEFTLINSGNLTNIMSLNSRI